MRNRNKTHQLNRTAAHRKALMRNLIDQLIIHGRIETTIVKAKELKRYADNFLSKMRKNDLSAKRKAISILRTKDAFKKLFSDEFIVFLNSRAGGYVRVMRTSVRPGDATRLAIIELTGKYEPKDTKKKAPKKVVSEKPVKEEVKVEEKVEEIKVEEKVEEIKEEIKVEKIKEVKEEVNEEKKVEEKKEEVKAEVPKEEKEEEIQPKEEKKEEPKVEEKIKVKAEAPKVEEKKEENKPQEEKVEEKPEEPKE